MITIKEYVEGLFEDIPASADKESIMQEIILNLEEKVQDLVADGKEEEDAINKAIVEFGEIDEIKNDLIQSAGLNPKKLKTKKRRNYLNNLWFSLGGSGLIIGMLIFANYYYTPGVIWFVFPTFAVLWWPLAMFFIWLNHRNN